LLLAAKSMLPASKSEPMTAQIFFIMEILRILNIFKKIVRGEFRIRNADFI